jgi:hypothetical protein
MSNSFSRRDRNALATILRRFILLTALTSEQVIVSAQIETKIGIIGDQSMSADLTASYSVLAQGLKELRAEHVDAVIHVGDVVESTGSIDEVRQEFSRAANILDGIGKPWHLAPGDHDVNPPQYQPDSKDDSRKRLFYELYHSREPQLTPGLWHSFDIHGYHFVSLNSQERLDVDPRWGDVFLSRISDEQLEWLRHDLESHRRAPGIVVFLHQPLWYNWAWWAPVHAVLRSHNVLAVIGGHFHYNQDEGEIDHVRYVVIGATGGSVKRADRRSGGVSEVAILTLRKRKPEVRLIALDKEGPLAFTRRMDMDRVQALDVILGELYHFPEKNQLCVRDGRLYGPSGGPPRLLVVPVGNPIDLPLGVSVNNAIDAKFSLDGPQFADAACQSRSPMGDCVLAPSSRVETSNNSLVVLNDHPYSPLPPLWQSGISPKPGYTPHAGDPISIVVKLTFVSGSQTHWIQGAATTNLTACGDSGK